MAQSKLDIVVGSNVGKALSGIKSVTSALAGVTGKIAGIVGIGGGIAAGFGIPAAFAAATTSAIRFGEEMAKLKSTLGATTQDVGMLQFLSKIEDVSIDTISSSLANLQQNMEHVAEGSAPDLAAKLAGVGISLEKLKGLSVTDMLTELSKAFQGISDNSKRIDIAKAIFGRSGTDMKNFLEKGPQLIQEMLDKAGGSNIYSENFAAKSDTLGDLLDEIKLKLAGLRNTAFEKIADSMIEGAKALNSIDFVALGENLGTKLQPIIKELSGLFVKIAAPGGFSNAAGIIKQALIDGGTFVGQKIAEAFGNTSAGRIFNAVEKSAGYLTAPARFTARAVGGAQGWVDAKLRDVTENGLSAIVTELEQTNRNTNPGFAPLPPPTPY